MSKEKIRKNPLQVFFSLGNKVTKGDPVRKAQFDYFFIWILFLAFMFMSLLNWYLLIKTGDFKYLSWALIGMAISWFQYWALQAFYDKKNQMKKLHSEIKKKPEKTEPLVEDSVEEMMGEFK